MKQELKRIDPLRTANIGALVYGALMCTIALILSPFVFLGSMFSASQSGILSSFFILLMLILYPIMGLVMGWISGLLSAVVYNFVRPWSGGLLFEFEPEFSAPGSEA